MEKIKAHISNIALSHTIFDLPFAYMGALMASNGEVSAWTIFLITLAVTSGRASALAIDNLVDLKYDKKQPRMNYRAMVQGKISKAEARIFILICLIILLITVAMLPPICLKLLPIAVIPFIIYPFTKRFTGYCHLFLGFALAMAPAGGWMAAGGKLFDPAMIFICAAVMFWIGGFDVIYGAQDEKFDKSQGLHSMTTEFGAKKAFEISRVLHVISIICLICAGIFLQLNAVYYVGILIAAITLIYQHSIVSPRDFHRITQAYFMRNGIVSVAIFICTWLNYL